MTEAQSIGVFNANGPLVPVTMRYFLAVRQAVSGSDARITWVSDPYLQLAGVKEWVEWQFSLPQTEHEVSGLRTLDCRKAVAAGLPFRPLETTVRGTLDWDRGRRETNLWSGLKPEQEHELLQAWHEANAQP